MKRFTGIFAVLFLGASLLAGCVAAPIEKSSIAQIEKGVSTKDDVKEILGEPDNETINDDQTTEWIYSRQQSGSSGLPIGGLLGVHQSEAKYQNILIDFNKKDVVTKIVQTYGKRTSTSIGR